MSSRLFFVLAALALSGCGPTDRRIVWDKDGCAFYVQTPRFGRPFVNRLPDADRAPCAEEIAPQ